MDPPRTPAMLVDPYGRHVSDLRVSLTDRAESSLFGVDARAASGRAALDPDKDSTDSARGKATLMVPEVGLG